MRRNGVLVFVLAVSACAPTTPDETLAAAATGVDLPKVAHPSEASRENARYVVLAKRELRIAGDPFPVAHLPADAERGFALEDKPAARDDRLVIPLDEALAWRPAASVVLVADATTPYRAAVEALTTALHAKATTLALAARDDGGKRVLLLPIELPSTDLRHRPGPSPVGVWIAKSGVSVRVGLETLAPGCDARGDEPTFPGALDAKALERCLARLVRGHDEIGGRVAFVGADPDAPLGDVVTAMAALRAAGFGYVGLEAKKSDAAFPFRGRLE